jgi:hypothetical protein
MESQLLPISLSGTQERSDSTDRLIKEWLFRFGVEHKEDVAPKLPLWLEAFRGIPAATLDRLFSRALRTNKFFPKVAEILEPLVSADKNAAPEAAETAWAQVLDIRRVYWNPDIPGPFDRAVACLSDRVRQAARAAGVFREVDSAKDLHVWAKKRFVESFIAYGELQQDAFLLPDGEIKDLLSGLSQTKMLPIAQDWSECRERGEAYRSRLATQGLPELSAGERLRVADQLSAAARKVLDHRSEHVVTASDETRKVLRRQGELVKSRYPIDAAPEDVRRYLLEPVPPTMPNAQDATP